MFVIAEELKKLPAAPGVYIMHSADDAIIYVGKAVNLRNRVRSYFRESTPHTVKISKMVSLVSYFEYIVTDSELEALVLENNLIKEHSPRYNTMLKDDKTYPYIKVTMGEAYPRVLLSREMKKDRSRYYGPFTSVGAVRDTIELIDSIYKVRTCSKKFPRDFGVERPCLNYHIGRCDAPCTGKIPEEEYRQRIDGIIRFLNGDYAAVTAELSEKMMRAAGEENFEEAIKYRDLLESVKKVSQKQKITDSDGEDKDVIALAGEGEDAVVQVFFIRGGKLLGREHFYMTHVSGDSKGQILGSFVKQFYAGTPYIPREIMLQHSLEPETDEGLMADYLSKRRGSRVYIKVPKLGRKEKLVELAAQNAQLVLSRDRERIKREESRTTGAVKELAELLGLEHIERMEAFDISNISGFENVGSMVVFEKGKPRRSDYRKFKIKTVSGPDDYACMYEVLSRRLRHGLEEGGHAGAAAHTDSDVTADGRVHGEAGPAGTADDEAHGDAKPAGTPTGFSRFPDLILMDGGRGQVNICLKVLAELGLDIPVCGMVKDDSHRTRGLYFENREIDMDRRSEAFKLITRVQDEAHRFAIEFHRSLRSKSQVKSVLDDIPGVGPARRKALMKGFESIEEIKAAGVAELLERVPELGARTAEAVHRFFAGL